MENIVVPLAPSRGIRCGLLNDARQVLSQPTLLPWQRNLIAYNSCCIRDISETLASNRGFSGARLSNDVSQILTGPALVAMATQFDTKQAITPLVWKISWCHLHLVGGIRGWAIEWRQTNSVTTNPVAMATPWQRNLIDYNSMLYKRYLRDACF